MSRLLFAAARGARLQREQMSITGKHTWWSDVNIQWGMDDELRIHPKDEHLQYGPVSSELRGYAYLGEGDYPYIYMTVVNAPLGSWWMRVDDTNAFERSDELTRSLFLLILSEALADEGL